MKGKTLLGLGLVGMAGCRHIVPAHVLPASAPKLVSGWTLGESRDHTVTIGVAPGWQVGVDKVETLGSALGDMGQSSPPPQNQEEANFQNQMGQMEANIDRQNKADEERRLANLESKGIIIHIISGGRPTIGETRTRYYVIKKHGDGPASWTDASEKERHHYAFPPQPTKVDLPIGLALRFAASDSLRDGSTRHEISYVILDDADTYTLRFITQESLDTISSIEAEAAKSLRIQPAKNTSR